MVVHEYQFQHSINRNGYDYSLFVCLDLVRAENQKDKYLMAKRRKMSLEGRIKKIAMGALPVIAGFMAVGLGIRYFGDKPVISDVAAGLNGSVKGSSLFSGWFG